MQKNYLFSVLAAAGTLSATLFTGCVDENYSFDDIDTTMKFEVNDLVLPLNLAPVTLSDLVDLSDEDGIEIINDQYVLLKEGSFDSQEVNIGAIHANPTGENSPKFNFPIPLVAQGVAVDIPTYLHKFNYNYDNVDKYIIDLVDGQVDLTLSLHLITKYDDGTPIDCNFNNLKVVLPKGFYGTLDDGRKIDATTSNVVTVANATTGNNGVFTLDFHVTEFNYAATGATLADGKFALSTEMGVESGKLIANSSRQGAGNLGVEMTISSLEVKSFTGTVYYDIDEMNTLSDISLSDLPDVLTDKRNQISLRNPQLYLSITNPLGQYKVQASTGMEITQVRPEGEAVQSAMLAERIEIAGVEGVQNFCLLPDPDADIKLYDKFPGAKKLKFTNFNNIVYGDGLPEALKVDFASPMLNRQTVKNFPLGVNLGAIGGEYTLFAPLEHGENSLIYYEDEATDWGLSSDSDELDIRLLSIDADVTSNLPIGVELTATPLNVDGKEIKDVIVTPVHVPANGQEHILIKMTGNIKQLDGMRYKAIINSAADAKALSPNSSLTLKNIKVKVSGSYIIKDEDND